MDVGRTRVKWKNFDISRRGISKFLNEVEELLLGYAWSSGEYGVDSASALRVVSERLPPGETVSRATIIHYLNKLTDMSILDVRETTGKGGHRKIYHPKLDRVSFIKFALDTVFQSLFEDFPDGAKEVLNGLTRERTHEELQRSYEELQSAHEALGRIKNELQLANEELISVNEELQSRNATLYQVYDELANLIQSANLPIIMVNTDLVIRDITPPAVRNLKIISTDVGRSILDLNLGIEVDNMEELVLGVLSDGQVTEVEVQGSGGNWYSMQIWPFLSRDNVIEGATILFLDITERKRAEEEIRSLARFPSENTNPVMRISNDGVILYANAASKFLLKDWGVEVGGVVSKDWQKNISTTLKKGVSSDFQLSKRNSVYSLMLVPVVEENYINVYGRDITRQRKI